MRTIEEWPKKSPRKLFVVMGTDDPYDKDKAIYTISPDPNKPGWETDDGQDMYGIPKEWAELLVKLYDKTLGHRDFLDVETLREALIKLH